MFTKYLIKANGKYFLEAEKVQRGVITRTAQELDDCFQGQPEDKNVYLFTGGWFDFLGYESWQAPESLYSDEERIELAHT